MSSTPLLHQALAAWQKEIKPQRVITTGERLKLVNQATFATKQRSLAILEPENRDEVIACLKVAYHFRIPLFPISTGLNWGYGSKVPPQCECVLLSLARLNQIVDHHEDLAYVTIEPGVTFRHLAQFLQTQKSRLLPPLTGTSPDASIIGNVLERGIGKGPYEDMLARSCGYEVILATGQTIQTGFSSFPGALTASLRKYCPGPSLQDLFNQSNLGIVTQMTLWLDPTPAWQQFVVLPISTETMLEPTIDALRIIRQRNDPRQQIELINDYRFLTQTQQYPYEILNGKTMLSPARVTKKLRASINSRWIVGVTLWADSQEELELRRRLLVCDLHLFSKDIQCKEPISGHEVCLSNNGLQGAYWRKRHPAPKNPDPDRDRCGVLWLTPVIPMIGAVAVPILKQIEEIVLVHGFEPSISLRFLDGRSIQTVVGLLYDRDEAGDDQRAAQCHSVLQQSLSEQGIYPYRFSLVDMESPLAEANMNRYWFNKLKHLFDPEQILAPGRYIPL